MTSVSDKNLKPGKIPSDFPLTLPSVVNTSHNSHMKAPDALMETYPCPTQTES